MRGLLACALVTLALAGCCGSGARARAERYAEINAAHAADSTLPPEARKIAEVNAESWRVQARVLGGKKASK